MARTTDKLNRLDDRHATKPSENRKLRCAVYTRKSTEEGLDQEINSLDAQREATAAYILSQKHEGWEMVMTGTTMAVSPEATPTALPCNDC